MAECLISYPFAGSALQSQKDIEMDCSVSSDAVLGAIKLSIKFLSQVYLLLVCDSTIIIEFHRLELIWIDLNNTSEVDKQYYCCIDFKIEVRSSQVYNELMLQMQI